MTRVYYKQAVGAFIVFDVTNAKTFDAVTKWKTDLDTKVTLPDGSCIPTVLLANKVDKMLFEKFENLKIFLVVEICHDFAIYELMQNAADQ